MFIILIANWYGQAILFVKHHFLLDLKLN